MIPGCNLFYPFIRILRFHPFQHLLQGNFCIGYDWHIYHNVTGNGCRINIHMNNLRFWCKFIQVTCDTVVETGSDGKEHITFADCNICRITAMHATASHIIGVICRNCAFSHNSRNNRNMCNIYYLLQQFTGTCNINTTAGKDQRTACYLQ